MFLVKRLIDIILSLVGIIILILFLPLVGLLIKLDSKGPVFYSADRVGKGMKIFKMYKFRTMMATSIEVGETVSPEYDPRVTTFGRFLRRTKINELPQFMNILKGEMTFVGPRPEAPDLAKLYPEGAKRVFSVKPGLVGPATILGRNEEEAYPSGVDPKKYYIEIILPAKNKIDLEYIDNLSVIKDLKYILTGVKETLVGAVSKRHIHGNRSQIYLLIADLILMVGSYFFASLIYIWILTGNVGFIPRLWFLPIVLVTRVLCNIHFGMYSSLIRYISYYEIKGVAKGVTCGTVLLLLFYYVFRMYALRMFTYSAFTAAIDWVCLIVLLSALRFGLRFYWDNTHGKKDERLKHRILIYGVCDEGNAACRTLTSEKYLPFEMVGFIDDRLSNYGKVINGKKVLGNRHHIKALAQLYRVEEVLVMGTEIHQDSLFEIMAICQEADLKCRIWNSAEGVDPSRSYAFQARNLDFSDILRLRRILANHAEVRKILTDKTVLVNGSGNALGLELCRKMLQLGCRRLIILDRYESYLNELVAALSNGFPHASIVPIITDTGRIGNLEEVFENYRPDIVIHAGMRKYEPFLAVDLEDIGQTNYLRTFNLAKVAAKFQCETFVMISSLTAAKNGNVLSDSLRIAEVSLEHFFSDTNTRLIIARICDVVENRGGIISIIENQMRNIETVILPYADAQVRLISKYSAAEFILQALAVAKENSPDKTVFVCDVEPPIPLIKVTRTLANIYGLELGSDLAVQYIGQSDEAVSVSPLKIGSSSSTFILPSQLFLPLYSLKITGGQESSGVSRDRVKSVFKDFVLAGNNESAYQDWRARTQELIELCKAVPLHQFIVLLGAPNATDAGIQPTY